MEWEAEAREDARTYVTEKQEGRLFAERKRTDKRELVGEWKRTGASGERSITIYTHKTSQ